MRVGKCPTTYHLLLVLGLGKAQAVDLHLVLDGLVRLTRHACEDLLLVVLRRPLFVHVCHLEPALKLPQLLALLADALDVALLAFALRLPSFQFAGQLLALVIDTLLRPRC